jgi:hypothetical protein
MSSSLITKEYPTRLSTPNFEPELEELKVWLKLANKLDDPLKMLQLSLSTPPNEEFCGVDEKEVEKFFFPKQEPKPKTIFGKYKKKITKRKHLSKINNCLVKQESKSNNNDDDKIIEDYCSNLPSLECITEMFGCSLDELSNPSSI